MLGASISQYFYPIFFQVQECLDTMRYWVQYVGSQIFGASGSLVELRPLFVVGIAVSLIFVAIILIKKVVWGR